MCVLTGVAVKSLVSSGVLRWGEDDRLMFERARRGEDDAVMICRERARRGEEVVLARLPVSVLRGFGRFDFTV